MLLDSLWILLSVYYVIYTQSSKDPGVRIASTDEPPDKYYNCYANIRFGAVVCIICEDAYYYSDFSRLKDKKLLVRP